MSKLSVVLATYNEQQNIAKCLDAVKSIADEIVIVDGRSEDRTVEIATQYGAKVIVADNQPIFHINKQKAIDSSTGDWILQLDADEIVSPQLAKEIEKVMQLSSGEMEKYQSSFKKKRLFLRHQQLIEKRDGSIGSETGDFNAFFIPRLNFFLGKYLKYGGVYPDGVIRLFKKEKAYLPCKDVHEQMVVTGRVGWLEHDLLHYADPTFSRYLIRNSRYINLIVDELKNTHTAKNLSQFINYMVIKPLYWLVLTLIRHKGLLDGFQGIVFAIFSALRFPRAYWRYLKS